MLRNILPQTYTPPFARPDDVYHYYCMLLEPVGDQPRHAWYWYARPVDHDQVEVYETGKAPFRLPANACDLMAPPSLIPDCPTVTQFADLSQPQQLAPRNSRQSAPARLPAPASPPKPAALPANQTSSRAAWRQFFATAPESQP